MEFFRVLPSNSLMDIMKCIKFVTRPYNASIIYNGDIMDTIHILCRGSMDVIDANGTTIRTIDKPEPLNVVDVLMDMPSMFTYVTRTNCVILQVDRNQFQHFLLQYPFVHDWIETTKNELKDQRAVVLRSFNDKIIRGVTPKNIYEHFRGKSFHMYEYKLKPDSFEEYDYYIPFDRLYPFNFVRFLLLRVTILPDGYFIYTWEGVRATVAIVSAIVHFVNSLADDKYKYLFYSLYIYGVLDMYVRLHVCYYNKIGVLVKHPLKTAKHYLTHGFFVDLVTLMPNGLRSDSTDYMSYFIGNIVRLLPLARYWQYIQTLKFSVIKSESKYLIFLYAPLILVLINFVGSFVINLQCTFGPNTETTPDLIGFTCGETSLLLKSFFNKPITVMRAHLYGTYFAASFLLLYGFRGYALESHETRMAASAVSFIGQLMTSMIIAKIFCMCSTHKTYITEQQAAMRRLKRFMKTINVSKRLMKIVNDSYEVFWKVTKGQTIHSVMGPFATPLKRDLFYEIYGNRLLDTSAFQNKSEIFYRNMLEYLSYHIIPKGGYLSTINDIEDTTYIIYSGVADVLSPDGSRLVTISEGAMYGNLEKKKYSRIGISIVAMSHVELLAIKSLTFYHILEYYPRILEEYQMLKKIHFTYIPSEQRRTRGFQFLTHQDMAQRSEGINLCQACSPHGVKIKIWTAFVVAYTCYFAVLVDLYHLACGDFTMPTIIMLYVGDVLYIIYFLTLDRLAYENETGYLVTDLMMIKQKLRKDLLRTWISIISIFPIDIIILASNLEEKLRLELFLCLRLNRALRLMHIFDYFSINLNKPNVRYLTLKIASVICWTVLFLVGFTAALIILACRKEVNMEPHVPPCSNISAMSPVQQIKFFIRRNYMSLHILTVTASNVYYPHNSTMIIFFVCAFTISFILQAFVFGQIFTFYNDLSTQKTVFKRRLDRLYYFLDREEVSISLVTRVKKYIHLVWMTTSGEVYPHLLKEAPAYLSEAVKMDAFAHLIVNHPVFANCHPDCLRQIVQKFEVHYLYADDYVQFKGSIDDSMYFVFTGSVRVLKDDYAVKRDVITELQRGDCFGIKQGLVRRYPHQYSYRCKRYSIIIQLNLDAWEYLLKFFPASKQVIYEEVEKYSGL